MMVGLLQEGKVHNVVVRTSGCLEQREIVEREAFPPPHPPPHPALPQPRFLT